MFQRILVPVDGSATSMAGLDEALKLARLTGGRIGLLHVVEELLLTSGYEGYGVDVRPFFDAMVSSGKAILAKAQALTREQGIESDITLVERVTNRASDVVLEQADIWKADLIVIGTHGRRGLSRLFLGSDAEQVLRQAKVPVLLIKKDKPGE